MNQPCAVYENSTLSFQRLLTVPRKVANIVWPAGVSAGFEASFAMKSRNQIFANALALAMLVTMLPFSEKSAYTVQLLQSRLVNE